MDNSYLNTVEKQRREKLDNDTKQKLHQEKLDAIRQQTADIVEATHTKGLAKTEDVASVTDAVEGVKEQAVSTVVFLADISRAAQNLIDIVGQVRDKPVPDQTIELHQDQVVEAISALSEVLKTEPKPVEVVQEKETAKQLKEIKQLFKKIDLSPVINVAPSELDISGITEELAKLPEVIRGHQEKLIESIPETSVEIDTSSLLSEIESGNARTADLLDKLLNRPIPVPETPLPFMNTDGKGVQVQLDGSGAMPISGSITATPSTLGDFSVNDYNTSTGYFGLTEPDGTWLVLYKTPTSLSYATVTNNGTVTSYSDAWTNRATLTYGRFDEAF